MPAMPILWRYSVLFVALSAVPAVGFGQSVTQGMPVVEEQTLQPIVITATRTNDTQQQAPASVYAVDSNTIQNNQLQVNLSESLAQVPGIQVQNRRNYAQDLQISMRGFGARSTFGLRGIRLYIDDIPATMPDGQGQTSNIDLTTADRIEVLTGPLSSLYGNSSGGTIQVFTEEGKNPPSITAQAAAASNNSFRYALNAQGGTNNENMPAYVLSQSRFTTDGYREHSQATKNLSNAKLSWAFADDSTLKLIVNHVDIDADDPMGLTRALWQQNPEGVDPKAIQFNTRKTVDQTQGGLVYEKPLSDQQTIRLMTYYGQRDTTQFQSIPVAVQAAPGHAGGVIDLGRDYYGTDLRWTGKNLIGQQDTTLIAGLAYDSMQEQRKGYENFINSPQEQFLGIQGNLRRNETNDLWNIDPYLQASWQFLPAWKMDAGLRYSTVRFDSKDHYITTGNGDDSGDKKYSKLLPSLAMGWQANPDLNLYGSYGRGFETPTFNEISYRPDGQPGLNFALQPATNDTYELGAKTRIHRGLLTAAVFQTNTDDEIVTATNNNGRSTYQNAGRTRRQGFETSWNGSVWEHLNAALAYTYLDAKYRDSTASFAQGNAIPGIARQSAYAGLDWAPEQGWQWGADVRYLDRIYVNDQNTDYAPAYAVTAIHAGYVWQLNPCTVRGFTRIDNLFDKNYSGSVIVNDSNQRYFEPAMGRNWSAGLTLTYQY